MTCDARIDDEETGVGISLHSRYVAGEDRMIEFSRDESRWGRGGTFALFEHGSALSGRNDTGVAPEARNLVSPESAHGRRVRPGGRAGQALAGGPGGALALAG